MIRCQNSRPICQCECSNCPPPAPSSNTSFQSLNLKSPSVLSIGPCGKLPQITWSVFLTLAIVFGFGLSCSKSPTLHHTRDSPLGLYSANLEAIGLLCMISGQLARSQFCALCGVVRCVCWRAVLLEGRKLSIFLHFVFKIWKKYYNDPRKSCQRKSHPGCWLCLTHL